MRVQESPLFFYTLFFLLGVATCLKPHWVYLAPVTLLLCVYTLSLHNFKRWIMISLLLSGCGYLHTAYFYSFPQFETDFIETEGVFHPTSLSIQSSPFGKSYCYQGIFQKEIPCCIYLPLHKKRPPASCDLFLQGRLLKKENFRYVFKPKTVKPIEGTFAWAERRFQWKSCFSQFLHTYIPEKNVKTFLTSMLTGEVDERVLNLEFNKLGLQHILGVSGFQFVLLASLIGGFLRLFLSYRVAVTILLGLLSLYFFFLGDSPPIQRAWISISITLIGALIGRRASPLNSLGLGLFIALLLNPFILLHIGFQLSFLCTCAILTLYPYFRILMLHVFPKRPFEEVLHFSYLDRIGYIGSAFLRESLALNLAVHLLSLPLLLVLFGKFPLMSFIYNLFFPLGASIVFVGSVIAIGLTFILPSLGTLVHTGNNLLTQALLELTSSAPACLEFYIRVPHFSFPWAVIVLSLIMSGIFYIPNVTRCVDSLLFPENRTI